MIGGWTEFQFAERRMPTLDEINAVAPDTPVFVLHLYDRALLNGAALRAVGYDKDAPEFPRRRSPTRPRGNPNRSADREAEREYSLLDPGQGAEAVARGSAQLLTALLPRTATALASPASLTPAAASRTIPTTTPSSTNCTETASCPFASPTTSLRRNRNRNWPTSRTGRR